jgi:hypothetical protein
MNTLWRWLSRATPALFAIPALLMLVGLGMSLKMFPLYSGSGLYNVDASYAYLFNGLLLLDGHAPYQTDHPGTPLQVLIAALVYLQWGYLRLVETVNADVVVAVMAEPERYLLFLSRALLALNGLALWFFGKKVYESTNSVSLATLCQCALLSFGLHGTKLLYPAPEALVACLAVWLIAVLSPLIFQRPEEVPRNQTKIALMAGLIFGLGFAVKLTFLPMAGLFLLFKPWRLKMLAVLVALMSWCVGIAPMAGKLPELWMRAYNMLTHTGKWGEGPKGLIDTAQLSGNYFQLRNEYPFFYIALFVFAAYLLFAGLRRLRVGFKTDSNLSASGSALMGVRIDRPLAILLLVCVAQTLIVLKHFGLHYMIPALPLAFVGAALLLQALLKNFQQYNLAIRATVTLGIASMLVHSVYTTFQELRSERVQNNRSVQQIQKELAQYPDRLVIGSYGCSLPQCGLLFGIEFAPAIDKKIAPFLANFYGFNVWNGLLLIEGHGFYPLTTLQPILASQRPVFLVTQIDFPAFDLFKKELILTARDQKLYKINGLTRTP